MAELETSAWLNDRRFRLLCFHGNSFAFSDLYFHTQTNPRRDHRARFRSSQFGSSEFGITAEATSQQVLSTFLGFLYLNKLRGCMRVLYLSCPQLKVAIHFHLHPSRTRFGRSTVYMLVRVINKYSPDSIHNAHGKTPRFSLCR